MTFPVAPSGEANRVRVMVYRTGAEGNPLTTFISASSGINTCRHRGNRDGGSGTSQRHDLRRPFTIPDRWTEDNLPANDTFDRYDNQGDLISERRCLYPWSNPATTARRRQGTARHAPGGHRQQHRADVLLLVVDAGQVQREADYDRRTSAVQPDVGHARGHHDPRARKHGWPNEPGH